MQKYGMLICLAIFMPTTWANSFFCPQTGQYVSTGDSFDHVIQACGAPAQTQLSKPQSRFQNVTRWTYNYEPRHFGQQTSQTPILPNTLIVDMKDNKVINLRVAGQLVTRTNICSSTTPLTLGMSMSAVESLCNVPSSAAPARVSIPEKDTGTQLTYQYYGSPTTLTFKHSVLVRIGATNT
jgi:hypothetical protein